MSTSLQNIVAGGDQYGLDADVRELFRPGNYPQFRLDEFYSHPLHHQSEQFNFFMNILEEWNRKVEQEEVPNHCQTLFHKNKFIFNSLRNAIMKPLNQSQPILTQLYSWFSHTRTKKLRPAERKPKESLHQDEDWHVRNTFKSNLPAEYYPLYPESTCTEEEHFTATWTKPKKKEKNLSYKTISEEIKSKHKATQKKTEKWKKRRLSG